MNHKWRPHVIPTLRLIWVLTALGMPVLIARQVVADLLEDLTQDFVWGGMPGVALSLRRGGWVYHALPLLAIWQSLALFAAVCLVRNRVRTRKAAVVLCLVLVPLALVSMPLDSFLRGQVGAAGQPHVAPAVPNTILWLALCGLAVQAASHWLPPREEPTVKSGLGELAKAHSSLEERR